MTKMKEEFNLSSKIEESPTFGSGKYQKMIYACDVKEFIKEYLKVLQDLHDEENLFSTDDYSYLKNKLFEFAGGELLK